MLASEITWLREEMGGTGYPSGLNKDLFISIIESD